MQQTVERNCAFTPCDDPVGQGVSCCHQSGSRLESLCLRCLGQGRYSMVTMTAGEGCGKHIELALGNLHDLPDSGKELLDSTTFRSWQLSVEGNGREPVSTAANRAGHRASPERRNFESGTEFRQRNSGGQADD